jgi:hypothetical protein
MLLTYLNATWYCCSVVLSGTTGLRTAAADAGEAAGGDHLAHASPTSHSLANYLRSAALRDKLAIYVSCLFWYGRRREDRHHSFMQQEMTPQHLGVRPRG